MSSTILHRCYSRPNLMSGFRDKTPCRVIGALLPAKSIMGFSEIRRLPISPPLLAQSRRNRKITHGIRRVRPRPLRPPLRKGGKGKAPPRQIVIPRNENARSATVLSATSTATLHHFSMRLARARGGERESGCSLFRCI